MNREQWLASEDPAAMLEFLTREETDVPAIGVYPLPRKNPLISDRKLRLFACACCRQVWHLLSEPSRRALRVAERFADGAADAGELGRAQDSSYYQKPEPGAPGSPERYANYMVANLCSNDSTHFTRSNYVHWPREAGLPASAQAALLRDITGDPFEPVTLPKVAVGTPAAWNPASSTATPATTQWHACPWLTPQVLSLARAAYEERLPDGILDPFRLALLADALEEAGCPAEMYAIEKAWQACRTCLGAGKVVDAIGTPYDPPDFAACPECKGKKASEVVARVARPNPLLAHLRSHGPHVRGCWAVDLILSKE